jgi:lipopolysaccharide/colanic/teichoic acid biosynthesis glycosyltransferase
MGRRAAALPLHLSRSRYQTLVKPVIDWVGAALLLILFSPVVAVVALAVALSSGGPVIFRQKRVGLDGQLFTVYKFATMIGDRRLASLPREGTERRTSHKRDNDPRLTPVGRHLRRWSLDELPQLWNVLRGEMSLVGPRPELPSIVAGFAPWQHERHAVKPGMTGFWQVYARGDGSVMHQRTDLDVDYVRQVSLWTDIKVLLLTLPAIVGLRRGF